MSAPRIAVRCQGGPRDGDTIDVPAPALSAPLYLSAPNAPGSYWRAPGLAPLVLTFYPAPGGQFVAEPEVLPFARELTLCQ